MLNACKLMEAEEYYAKGYLNTAKDMYAALPEGFSYGDISAAARLETLNAHADFLEICGRWRCDAITSSVRQTHDSTGLWDEWEGDGSGYTVDITCVINDDDTVTMTAEAEYWRYTNYSLLSRNLKTTDNTMKFEYTGASRPSSVDEDYTNSFSGNHITSSLTIQPNNFVFSWLCVDENYSMDFTYRYKTNGTYDTFVEAH